MISAHATIAGKRHNLRTEAVLSRCHVAGCANCQTHLEAKAFIGLPGFKEGLVKVEDIGVEMHTRDGTGVVVGPGLGLAVVPRPAAAAAREPYWEVR